MIRQVLCAGRAVALMDSGDGCDVARAWPEEIMARLLWVRCHGVEEAVRAMDLLVRDGNVRHLIMDLREDVRARRALSGSGRVSHPGWYRLRNVAEENGLWVIVASGKPVVPCAVMRCRLTSCFRLEDLSMPREELLERVTAQVERRRGRQQGVASETLRQVG